MPEGGLEFSAVQNDPLFAEDAKNEAPAKAADSLRSAILRYQDQRPRRDSSLRKMRSAQNDRIGVVDERAIGQQAFRRKKPQVLAEEAKLCATKATAHAEALTAV